MGMQSETVVVLGFLSFLIALITIVFYGPQKVRRKASRRKNKP